MIKLTLSEIIGAIQAECAAPAPPVSIPAVQTDSRRVQPGELFFALAGSKFDGHDFVEEAFKRGAAAAVIRKDRADRLLQRFSSVDAPLPLLIVDDTLAALGRLGLYHRRQLAAEVIAVVGSNGKTTTKGMIDHILGPTLAGRCSPKSFNNAIGVPLTLLSAEKGDDYLVVEIGTNAPGEIDALGRLVEPNMVVITSIGEEHLQGLGTLEGVAVEETSILRAIRRGGFAAVNTDSDEIRPLLAADGFTLATFGRNPEADLHLTDVRYDPPWTCFELNGRFRYRVRAPGSHNAVNAAGAITISRRLGLDHPEIAARLESFTLPPMRNEVTCIGPITVINDAYNANPASALAAFDVLAAVPAQGRRIAVFGEMRELGREAVGLHARVGRELARHGVDLVVLVGPAAELMADAVRASRTNGTRVECCASVSDCGSFLESHLREGDVVLLKASRAVELERVLEPLRRRFAAADHAAAVSASGPT